MVNHHTILAIRQHVGVLLEEAGVGADDEVLDRILDVLVPEAFSCSLSLGSLSEKSPRLKG